MDTYQIRTMTIKDYEEVYTLWTTIHGFGMRSLDDSKEGVQRFLQRNPSTSVVAVVKEENKEKIVGAILCGHDVTCMKELQKEQINKVCLIAFKNNEVGNVFWKSVGWTFREDLNYYDFTLNEENITRFNS